MLSKDSVIVQIWSNAVKNGEKRIEEVPNLSNLRILVSEIIKGV